MEQQSLFGDAAASQPLAARLRPRSLDEYVGQSHLLGPGKVLRRLIEADTVSSMIFWGPPGVGKTTLARIIAGATQAAFVDFSAVTSGIKEIREVMAQAERGRAMGQRTLLFVDEIHRFNKAQQDAFLPFVEKGAITLIGATTENPSFEINSALLSRCKVFVLNALSVPELCDLLRRALGDPRGFGYMQVEIGEDMLEAMARFAGGDARVALSTLEMAVLNGEMSAPGGPGDPTLVTRVTPQVVEQCISRRSLIYDKNGEEHYNIISALHKSMRNSDPDAAIYWLARMLEAGEDPLYVARRLIRFASEDVGMADSRALGVAIDGWQACHFLGMPECTVHLTHVVVFLSLAPKSNALYLAYGAAAKDARETLAEPVPLVIRNAPTQLMKDLEYGKGYTYAHDYEHKITPMVCLPDALADRQYYHPTQEGREKGAAQLLERIRAWKQAGRKQKNKEDS